MAASNSGALAAVWRQVATVEDVLVPFVNDCHQPAERRHENSEQREIEISDHRKRIWVRNEILIGQRLATVNQTRLLT